MPYFGWPGRYVSQSRIGIWHFGVEEMDYLYEQNKDAYPDGKDAFG